MRRVASCRVPIFYLSHCQQSDMFTSRNINITYDTQIIQSLFLFIDAEFADITLDSLVIDRVEQTTSGIGILAAKSNMFHG